ncbi:hypothetical protein COT20_01360 [bacterium (Candidatus Gribaldobacteria) CG08_land_8_20_14_0_20_39_15]|uniref:Restriction endonuclease n=1 Tax=bacterium (Candidatus Gribaldobacteria) CG08_land_8_20_14_0_20_39_15 TaxID=2014273 RepID=A0A2M6XUL5_9BACT|nr:MAG: hypothetical protein COT20_01360 [bacterium (Candidatus Gribaldobacteria) CG08_land_8_20_14_0_20_39_15]
MNTELLEVLKIYSTKPHKEFSDRLTNSSKETIIAVFTDILTMYINDKNSSTIRECLTVTIAGYKHSEKKIGFNGFKQNSIVGGKPIACEAKPKNFNTEDLLAYEEGIKKTKPAKLNGGGNFTDYTFARLKKDKKENPHILASGFVDGELIYVLEFPFNCPSFVKRLKIQIKKRFPNGDKSGEFLRSANFTFEHYKNYKELKVIYLEKEKLEKNKKYLTKKYYDFLFKK